jgi:hypothetical protein
MSGDRRFAGPRTGRCPRYAPSPCSPSIRYMLRKGMEWDAKRRRKTCGEIGLALLVAVSRYGTSVRYRAGPGPGVRDLPELQYEASEMSSPKNASIAILLAIVARIRSRHLSSKVDRCLSLLPPSLGKSQSTACCGESTC